MSQTEKLPKITISDDLIKKSTLRHNWLVVLLPTMGFIFAIGSIFVWGIHFWEILLLISMYAILMTGVEVGIHRHFSHKAFEARPVVRAILALLGSMAFQGPFIYWVANHRRHHTYSDHLHDLHSPHFRENSKGGGIRGLWYAHVGWFFDHGITNTAYFAGDLLRDPVLFKINQYYLYWVLLGLVIPTLIGWNLTATWEGAIGGLLWGGFTAIFLAQHSMFSINSITHYFGSRPFQTQDESRNNIWLALPTFGQAWHNNHHAFPSSAVTGLKWWQIDIGGRIIRGLGKLGLAWNLKIPTTPMIEEKLKK